MEHLRIFFYSLLTFYLLVTQPVAGEEPTIPPTWTVQDAVHYALRNNPGAKAAIERIRGAGSDISRAKAAFYPHIGLSAEYGRTNNPMYSFGNILNQSAFDNSIDFNDPGVTDNLQLKALVQYRFYNGGQDQAALDAAEAKGIATELQKVALHSRIGFEVVQAFYLIIQAEETLAARNSAVKAIKVSTLVAKARYDEGDLLKADLLNLEVQLARASEDLIQTRHGLALARRGFLKLLGLTSGKVSLDQAGSARQQIPSSSGVHNRPEITAMEAMIDALEAKLRQANASNHPTADAFGSYQVDHGFELEDGSGNSWLAGLRLNYTLFDGKMTSASIQKATAGLAEAREQKRQLELAVNFEIEQARLTLQQAEERIEVTAKMVALAMESARLSRVRFKEGVILSSDLIETEKRLTDAKVHDSLARTTRNIAVADLRRARGVPQF